MNAPTTFRTPDEKRVELVKQTLMTSSTLDDDSAGKLAVQVLHTLDSIPEKIRYAITDSQYLGCLLSRSLSLTILRSATDVQRGAKPAASQHHRRNQ
jgi:hypothetical protein